LSTGFGNAPLERRECLDSVVKAAASAFANQRSRRAQEFRGEEALICTCFNVTEDRIRQAIADERISSVQRVGEATNAGTGCGSCQLLIQEILDSESGLG
jgi:NAD(P)H-nitrite reductase large subunit